MTSRQIGNGALIGGVLCLLVGGLLVVLRSLGLEPASVQHSTWLPVLGLMLVAAGAGSRRR